MKTAVSYIQTNLLDYETGENDRKICIRTADGNLKYSYLLKWLGATNEEGEFIITEIPDRLIADVINAYYELILGEWPISELAMTTLMWGEVNAIFKSGFRTRGSKYDLRTLTDLACTDGWVIDVDDSLHERMMIVEAYIEAYLVLKGRINKVKHLEIVQEYIGQKSLIEVLKRESEKFDAVFMTKNDL